MILHSSLSADLESQNEGCDDNAFAVVMIGECVRSYLRTRFAVTAAGNLPELEAAIAWDGMRVGKLSSSLREVACPYLPNADADRGSSESDWPYVETSRR